MFVYPPLIFLFSMPYMSYQKKAGDWFFLELFVIYRPCYSGSDAVLG
jgi:hypothetical protein